MNDPIERAARLEQALRSTDMRSGLVILVIACSGLVGSVAAIALLLVNLQQLRDVTLMAAANKARLETLEGSQSGIQSFTEEARIRLVNIELMQSYAADSYETILQALHVEPKKRPQLQPHEWPRPEPAPPPPPVVFEIAPPLPYVPPPPQPERPPWWKFWEAGP